MTVPRPVRELAAGQALRLVWRNELGGLTFEIGTASDRWFVKWMPTTSGVELRDEVHRLAWAARFTPVPRVLGHGADATGSWLATAALPGDNAVIERWRTDPAPAVFALGSGLRALHDALPVPGCPFTWSAAGRLAEARDRAAAGLVDVSRWHAEYTSLGVEGALEVLTDIPPVDRLVVCHGDACAPNTIVTADGRWSGHVDLGSLGVADRWADIAVATWSTEWNYGPGWEDLLLGSYGVSADPVRTDYYRLLWDLGP